MPSPNSFAGTVASAGYAAGPLFRIDCANGAYEPSGQPATESARLRAAIARGAADLAALAAATGGEGADMLEFQVALLEDPSLSDPAYQAIAGGRDAAAAWAGAMDAEIAGYEAAADPYFRARSADLMDVRARVTAILAGATERRAPQGAVIFGRDLLPTQFLATDWSKGGGIVLAEGSAASHVAMLARTRGVPMLIGVGAIEGHDADLVLLDAEHGVVVVRPDDRASSEHMSARDSHNRRIELAQGAAGQPAATADGTPVKVMVNIAEAADVDHIDVTHCDGVGLMRTEFLFGQALPDEDTQYRSYRRVLEWAAGRPVVVRTLDAGGDKPVPGVTVSETNPFLGLRGIRLSLRRPDVFRVQIRALLRAASHGNLSVMLPMVTVPAELEAARALFAEEAATLGRVVPPLGIMVEVPAAAIAPELFAAAAFFSIGSNDLTQYVMAAGRDNGAVAALADVTNPAVLRLIETVARFGAERGMGVSLCGDAGGDPAAIPHLLKAGLRSLSVAPTQLGAAKLAISGVSL